MTVRERLVLLGLLPAEGDLTMIRIVHRVRQQLAFSEDEHKQLKFVQAGERMSWTDTDGLVKAVPIGLQATNLIVTRLTELSKAKKLTEEHLSLVEKFIGPESAEDAEGG